MTTPKGTTTTVVADAELNGRAPTTATGKGNDNGTKRSQSTSTDGGRRKAAGNKKGEAPAVRRPAKKRPSRKEDESESDEDGQQKSSSDAKKINRASGKSLRKKAAASSESSSSGSSSDDDSGEEGQPDRSQASGGNASVRRTDSMAYSPALLSKMRQHRSVDAPADWLTLCAVSRHYQFHAADAVNQRDHDNVNALGEAAQNLFERVTKRWADESRAFWAWVEKSASLLTDGMKAELLLTTLAKFGETAGLRMFVALGCPVYLNDQFAIRCLWSAMDATMCERVFVPFLLLLSADSRVQQAYGPRHVLIRLVSRYPGRPLPLEIEAIESLSSPVLLRKIRSPEDVNDLLTLGWRPNVATVMEHAQNYALGQDSLIRRLAPVLWTDLSTTLPIWHDSPYDPASSVAPSLDSQSEFWNSAPEYWLVSQDQIRAQYPSFAEPRSKMAPMASPDLQRVLTLMHKAPTLLRQAWACKSLTWLNYVLLFRMRYFHSMVQVLLRAPAPKSACMCYIDRLERINVIRRRRGHRGAYVRDQHDAGIGPRGHGCHPECGSLLVNSQQCMPWYRCAPPNTSDPDRMDIIDAALPDRKLLHSPYSLNRLGRAVAIAHFIILMTAKGVTATSLQLLGDVVTSWPRQPPVKDLRPLLAKIWPLAQALSAKSPLNSQKIDSDVKHASSSGSSGSVSGGAAEAVGASDHDRPAAVIGALGGSGVVQSHILYRRTKDAPISAKLKKLHFELAEATCKCSFAQPLFLQNEQCQLLREIYDDVNRLITPT